MPSKRSQVPPFEVMTVLDQVATLRAQGVDVISLCAGEPAGGAPSPVNAAAAELHSSGRPFGYTPALGIWSLREALAGRPSSQIISSASQLLSSLTHFAGVVIAPRRQSSRIRQIEFLSLSEKRILLIIVTADGDVQNRIISTDKAYSASELVSAANYLTQNFAGLDFEQMRQRLSAEIRQLRDDIKPLMALALEAGDAAMSESATPYVISGEKNLLDVEELSSNMKRLRELFDLFEQRSSLMRLLDVSNRAEGVQIFIGGESGIAPLDECSVIAAPYTVDGQVVGSVGVIGPTRMAYERVIPIVDITARLLSSALSYKSDN